MSDDKGKGGRPTKYNDEMQAKADAYLKSYESMDQEVPSFVGLCLHLQISRSTGYLWQRTHEEFSRTLDDIQMMQELRLVTGSLRNDLNATIAKLMLANHGYSDKQSVEHSGAMTTHAVSYSADDYKAAREELEKRMD